MRRATEKAGLLLLLLPVMTERSGSKSKGWRCEGNNPFCLGMGDLCGCKGGDDSGIENVPPNSGTSVKKPHSDAASHAAPPKRLKLSLKKPRPESRFGRVDEEEMSVICKGYVPPNTAKNTRWSMSVFNEWRSCRNKGPDEQRCPDDILERHEAPELNFWLARFVAEVRRSDGQPHPPKSIHQLICGILRYMRSIDPKCPNVLDREEKRFHDFHCACEVIFRRLHQSGVGTDVKHTALISSEEEDKLWSSGTLSVTDPKGLQYAVFFYVGKVYCIRGGEEQRSLKPSQFVRSHEPDCYTYIEHGSKTRSGGLAQLHIENKRVPCYANPENEPRCLVFLLDLYLAKLPRYAFEKDVFYL